MTSYFARHYTFSEETLDAYPHYSRSISDRLRFYIYYLQDVVPLGVTVHSIPGVSNTRHEIQLRVLSGAIFMTGLVSMELRHDYLESVAADEAYTKFLDGYFVHGGGRWRFFTATSKVRVFNSDRGDGWVLMGEFRPLQDTGSFAAYLQREYDSLGYY